jgi:Putative Zn-dependent protease, contains TPR repeats
MIDTLPIYDIDYLYNVATEAANAGEDTEALAYLDRVLASNPRHAMAWCVKGNCLDSLDRCEEALDAYDRALQIDPDDSDTWFNRGLTLRKMGREKESKRCMKKALRLAIGE